MKLGELVKQDSFREELLADDYNKYVLGLVEVAGNRIPYIKAIRLIKAKRKWYLHALANPLKSNAGYKLADGVTNSKSNSSMDS